MTTWEDLGPKCTSTITNEPFAIMAVHIQGKYHLHKQIIYCSFPSPIDDAALTTDYLTASTEVGLKCNSEILNGPIASLCNNY